MISIKTLAERLPRGIRNDLKRWHFRRQMRAGDFIADEPEIFAISELVRAGDVVIDVGANVGAYALHMSKCVGPQGRVIAFEPMIETFTHLSAVVHHANMCNITLMNLALSDTHSFVSMDLPTYDSGARNYYRASISDSGTYRVMCMPLDSLPMPVVTLIKIDAEGHDLQVLKGAQKLIERDKPVLVVEAALDSDIAQWIGARGYKLSRFAKSPNIVAIDAKDRGASATLRKAYAAWCETHGDREAQALELTAW